MHYFTSYKALNQHVNVYNHFIVAYLNFHMHKYVGILQHQSDSLKRCIVFCTMKKCIKTFSSPHNRRCFNFNNFHKKIRRLHVVPCYFFMFFPYSIVSESSLIMSHYLSHKAFCSATHITFFCVKQADTKNIKCFSSATGEMFFILLTHFLQKKTHNAS